MFFYTLATVTSPTNPQPHRKIIRTKIDSDPLNRPREARSGFDLDHAFEINFIPALLAKESATQRDHEQLQRGACKTHGMVSRDAKYPCVITTLSTPVAKAFSMI